MIRVAPWELPLLWGSGNYNIVKVTKGELFFLSREDNSESTLQGYPLSEEREDNYKSTSQGLPSLGGKGG